MGYRKSDYLTYLSDWVTFLPKSNTVTNRNLCWAKAQENVAGAVGYFWQFDKGWCRAIDNLVALGTFQSTYPDDQDTARLCIFETGNKSSDL